MHGDIVYYSTDMNEMMSDLLFWQFHRGMYWKDRATEFLQAYEELKVRQPSKDAYKIRHDFAVQKAESIVTEIFYLIS